MIKTLFRKTVAVIVASALLILTPGLPCYQALAGEVGAGQSEEGVAPINGNFGGQSLGGSALSSIQINPDAFENLSRVPDIAIPGAAQKPLPVSAAASGFAAPANIAPADASGNPAALAESAIQNSAPAANVAREAAISHWASSSSGQAGFARRAGSFGWLTRTAQNVGRWLKPGTSVSGLKAESGKSFDAARIAGIETPSFSASLRDRVRAHKKAALSAAVFVAAMAAAAIPAPARAAAAAAAHGGWAASALHAAHAVFVGIGPAGAHAIYLAVNILAAAMALPEVLGTFRKGSAKHVPLDEIGMAVTGSAFLGLVIAPLKGYWAWAAQNNFGGLTMLSVIPIGWILSRGGIRIFGRRFLAPAAGPSAEDQARKKQGEETSFLRRMAGHFKDRAVWRTIAAAVLIGAATVGLTSLATAFGPVLFPPVLSFIASLFPTTPLGAQILTGAALLIPMVFAFKALRGLMRSPVSWKRKALLGLPLLAAFPAMAFWIWPMAGAWALPMTADKIVSLLAGAAGGLFVFLFAPEVIRAMVAGEGSSHHFNWRTSLIFSLASLGLFIYWGNQYFVSPAAASVAAINMIENAIGGVFSTISFFLAWRHRSKVADAARPKKADEEIAAAGEIQDADKSPPGRAPPAQESPGQTAESLKPHVYENALGFRRVKGLSYAASGAKISRLPNQADAGQIISQISSQFNISRDKILSIAAQGGLSAASPAARWLAVYDALQKTNYEQFKERDHAKYGGSVFKETVRKAWAKARGKPFEDSASFRNLANKTYAPGWKGAAQRLAGAHRYLIFGFWFRFIYDCFDSFVLGYFRQAMSFHFKHGREDFLNLAPASGQAPIGAEKALAAAVAGIQGRTLTIAQRLRSTPAGRAAWEKIVKPFLAPLAMFLRRRLVMALLSAVAMGILGAMAPAMPFMSVSILSLPLMGPLLLHAVHLFLFSVAAVPVIGPFLTPVLANAVNALLKDLVIGPLLNTYLLSFFMTLTRRPISQWGRALRSGAFWGESVKSFLSMMTVGAEIAGALSYFAGADKIIDTHGFYQLVGRHIHEHFRVFHALGSAVESPKGQSLIPFGGAITWGNAILYHLENALHFNISNWIAAHLNPAAAASIAAGIPIQQTFQAATSNQVQKDFQFSSKDYLNSPKKADADFKRMESKTGLGELKKELAQASAREKMLEAARARADAQIAALKGQARPITARERTRYRELIQELSRRRAQEYDQGKLAEKRDLTKGPDAENAARLKDLTRLKEEYAGRLNPKPTNKTDYWHSLGVKESVYKSLSGRISQLVAAGGGPPPDKTAFANSSPRANPAKIAEAQAQIRMIEKSIGKIQQDRQGLETQVAEKQALEKLMDAEARLRQIALNTRRNGQAMMNFHQSLSQVDTVMGLALSRNELNSALAAITRMQTLINTKDQGINQSLGQDQANLAQIQQTLSQEQQQWQQQAQTTINGDNQSQSDMQATDVEVKSVAGAVQSFSQNEKNLLAAINSTDGGASGNALTEYARRLALIKSGAIVQWETSGGNPNVTFTLSELNGYLQEITSGIQSAQAGIQTLKNAPLEYAETAIFEVPGPQVSVPPNATKGDILNILAQRQTYWQAKLSGYESLLTTIQQLADPKNTTVTQNVFGDSQPQSLPVWKSQEQGVLSQSQSKITSDAAQMDQLAQSINTAFGANLPMLSGMTLAQLQNAVQAYAADLESIKTPSGTNPKIVQAKMSLVSLAYLISDLGNQVISESVAQQTISDINSALATTLPQAAQGIAAIVQMAKNVLADEQMDVAYVNGDKETQQQLLNRKINLLQNELLPPLNQAQSMLQNDLIPYQQQSIAGYQDNPSATYEHLYTTKQSFLTEIETLNNATMPWSIETFGGSSSDKSGSLKDVAAWKSQLEGYLNGYTDSSGVTQQGLSQALLEAQDRLKPNFQGDSENPATENVYGEAQPFSLPDKITKYTAEMGTRADQINANDARINAMIEQIKTLSNGQYDLTSYLLPTGVAPDANGINAVQAVVNANTIPQLGTALKQVAKEALAAAGSTSISIGSGGGGTVPTGPQPSPSVSNDQKIALLVSQIAPVLALQSAPGNPSASDTADAVARFLYSNGVIESAQNGEQFIKASALPFIHQGIQVVGDAISDADARTAYVNSGGTSMTAEQVYAQEIKIFNELDGFLQQAQTFYGEKGGFDAQSLSTISTIVGYYQSLETIDQAGVTAAQGQLQADQTILQALQATQSKLQTQLTEVNGWLSQLNDPHDSALRRTSDAVSAIMDQTRQVLDQNMKFRKLQSQVKGSDAIIEAKTRALEKEQDDLQKQINAFNASDPSVKLPDADAQSIQNLRAGQGMWEQQGNGGDFMVVPKSRFPSFVYALLKSIAPQDSEQEINQIAQDLARNPQSLMSLIPGSEVMNFGDSASGFYMVYQSNLSVPRGISTTDAVTLGNVAKIFGNNISMNGYQFESPPYPDNAPWGDKGIGVQVESLQGKNWVNYLNIDLHRFGLSVPPNDSLIAQAQQDRILVFDDYAMMAMNGKLYVGLAGFGDGAIHNPSGSQYYYGGNLKTAIQMNPVMSLTADQQELFAKDPRTFLENVNLNFTGFDPTLNQNFAIAAHGDSKYFSRTKVGPSFNLARLFDPKGNPDAFTLDLYYDRINGTDDISQQALGATVLKGFSLRKDDGEPWLTVTNRLSGEAGQKYNMASDDLSVNLPDGLVFSGNGQIMGSERAFYAQIAKKMSGGSQIQIGYGSPVIGMNNRFSITTNSSYSLGQIWRTVSDQAATDVNGGSALKSFDNSLTQFFSANQSNQGQAASDLQKVFMQYAGERLAESKTIGDLSKQIKDLQRAGAFLDNTRVESVLGFVSRGVSNDPTELAVGGGPVAGTDTQMILSRTQKDLIADKTASLLREGLRLQDLMVGLTQTFQESVKNVVEAEGNLRIAQAAAERLPRGPQRDQALVEVSDAQTKLNQSVIRFNILTGRDPKSAFPLQSLQGSTLEDLMAQLKRTITVPGGLTDALHQADPEELQKRIGSNPFNILDKIPWVERMTFDVGTQLQDAMSNQMLGVGGSVRLPIYDPTSKDKNHAYRLENRATLLEIQKVYEDHGRAVEKELLEAKLAGFQRKTLRDHLTQASLALSQSAAAYRNGLAGPGELQKAYQTWMWYYDTYNNAMAQEILAKASSSMAGNFLGPAQSNMGPTAAPMDVSSFSQALSAAISRSRSLEEMAAREEAAQAMTAAASHRIQKAYLDISIGGNLVASGENFIPAIGLTGFPVMPIFTFKFEPSDLRDLDRAQNQAESKYYGAVKSKLRADLAFELYQDISSYQAALEALKQFDDVLIPEREKAAERAQKEGSPIQSADAARRLDQARLDREQIIMAGAQALASVNMLLGRNPASPLDISVDPAGALNSLEDIYKSGTPAQAQSEILKSQTQIAQTAEKIADRGEKVQELSAEPVSLIMRAAGRLIRTLSGNGLGNPDLKEQALLENLKAQRAQESFAKNIPIQESEIKTQINAVNDELSRLSGRGDPQSRIKAISLTNSRRILEAQLAGLGGALSSPIQSTPAAAASMPATFAELKNRLEAAEQAGAARPNPSGVGLANPEVSKTTSDSFVRYYYARQTLGKTQIHRGYVEAWLEARLRSSGTSPQDLIKLEAIREKMADESYKTAQEKAATGGDILAADFAAKVGMMRFIESRFKSLDIGPGGQRQAAEAMRNVRESLGADQTRIIALLGLDPKTSLDELAALVPQGPSDPLEMGKDLIDRLSSAGITRLRETLFNGELKLPSDPNAALEQVRTDILLRSMSADHVTPVAAFGIFRGQSIGGLFLQAPDPQSVEQGLSDILSQDMVAQLKSKGELRDLSLHLSELMGAVQGDAQILESQRRLIESSQAQYVALLGEADNPKALEQAQAAQSELVHAWLAFNSQIAKSKADLLQLSSEIKALDLGREESGYSSSSSLKDDNAAAAQGNSASSRELISYWSDRMGDPKFADRQKQVLNSLGLPISEAFKERLLSDAQAWEQAKAQAKRLRLEDLPAQEKLRLLTGNDAQGKKEFVERDLSALLAAVSHASRANASGPGKPMLSLMEFLKSDLDQQTMSAHDARFKYNAYVEGVRKTFWDSMAMPPDVAGSFAHLEALDGKMRGDWQALMDAYMSKTGDTESFLMKDEDLDAYLQDQHAFNQEIVSLLKSKDVMGNADILNGIESLYDVRTALGTEIETARFGRGMAALNALIELNEVRLSVARWENRSPDGIAAIAQSLENLKSTKERWMSGKNNLQPLYAVMPVSRDGKRLASVGDWLTQQEVDKQIQEKIITRGADGRLYLQNPSPGNDDRFEVVPGVDAAQYARDAANDFLQGNASLLGLTNSRFDFVPVSPGSSGEKGYSSAQVFGLVPPKDENGTPVKMPIFFFFQAPGSNDPDGDRARILPQAEALEENPSRYVVYAYTGDKTLSYDHFPTLKNLKDSEEYKDSYKLALSPKGAMDMIALAEGLGRASLSKGWISLKLNSYGFAADGGGRVREIYQNRAEFDSAWSKFRNAKDNLSQAQEALRQADKSLNRDVDKAKPIGQKYERGLSAYQRDMAARKNELTNDVAGKLTQKQGEPDRFYKIRVENRVDQLIKEDSQTEKIERKFKPYADAYNKEEKKLEAERARVNDQEAAVASAQKILEESKAWGVFKTDDLDLELDKNGALTTVKAAPVFGHAPIDSVLDKSAVAIDIKGPLYAAVLDRGGRIMSYYQNAADLEKAAKNWMMRGIVMKGENPIVENGHLVKTNYRLDYYVDPATHLPVELSARYINERVAQDKRSLFVRDHWGFLPQNWLNLAMEVPNEIIGTPIEIAGRDPNQEHYLGRINMKHGEGGETNHYGFFRKALGVVDILDLLPDPVDIYNDPSQFPDQVHANSPILPGQEVYAKSLRDAGNGKNFHFGAGAVAQGLRYSIEDLADTREKTLSYFEGGYEDLIIARMRGRAGTYEESQRVIRSGGSAVRSKVENSSPNNDSYDPLVAADPHSGMNGVSESASPDNILTDRIQQNVTVRLGAQQYGKEKGLLKEYSSQIQDQIGKAKTAQPNLENAFAAARKALQIAIASREDSQDKVANAWDRYRALNERMEDERALEQGLSAWRQEEKILAQQIADNQAKISGIQKQFQNQARKDVVLSSQNRQSGPIWPWLMMLAGMLSLFSAAWQAIRRRFQLK
ncbi:MAG: hypothetical protein ACYCPQ_01550 [Elusimicrobiota bacterium]